MNENTVADIAVSYNGSSFSNIKRQISVIYEDIDSEVISIEHLIDDQDENYNQVATEDYVEDKFTLGHVWEKIDFSLVDLALGDTIKEAYILINDCMVPGDCIKQAYIKINN